MKIKNQQFNDGYFSIKGTKHIISAKCYFEKTLIPPQFIKSL
jgi:hypothetical protein